MPTAFSSLARALAVSAFLLCDSAMAGDWHYCVATAGINDGANKHVHWAVTQPFDTAGIPDWRDQFEQVKSERKSWANARGWSSGDDGFICTDSTPDLQEVLRQREMTVSNYQERSAIGDQLGVAFSWEDWDWAPTGTANAGPAGVDEAGADSDADDSQDPESGADGSHAEAANDATHGSGSASHGASPTPNSTASAAKPTPKPQAAPKPDAAPKPGSAREFRPETSSCVSPPVVSANKACGKGTAAAVVNQCPKPVDVRICLKTENGWDCGVSYGLVTGREWSYPSCKGTEQVFSSSRYSDRSESLPSP